MPDTPAYTTVPGKLADLLGKARQAGVPTKATVAWLKSLGFTSSNDLSLLPVLRQIGFIDSSNAPTPVWKQYRGADSKAVLGRAIRQGYDWLFNTYPDAHQRPATDLGHVFSTRTDAGKQTIDKMVGTFKNLASLAEFTQVTTSPKDDPGNVVQEVAPGLVTQSPQGPAHPITVNVNVQLTLPETTNEQVFAAFFKAMRTHLLSDGDR